jgi:hypothetical protein
MTSRSYGMRMNAINRILGESDVEGLTQHFKDALDLIVQFKTDIEHRLDNPESTQLDDLKLKSYRDKYGFNQFARRVSEAHNDTRFASGFLYKHLQNKEGRISPRYVLKLELQEMLSSLIEATKSGEIPITDLVSDILRGDPFEDTDTVLSPEVVDPVVLLLRPYITAQDIKDIYAGRI